MKKVLLALCATLLAAFMLTACTSSPAPNISNGAIDQDGSYTVPATLEGGSGRASIQSPVAIKVENKTMTATFIWSSPNYDLMIVDAVEYRPVSTEGGAKFEIPIASLEEPLAVQAETTAMGTPHLIEYRIVFDSQKIKAA